MADGRYRKPQYEYFKELVHGKKPLSRKQLRCFWKAVCGAGKTLAISVATMLLASSLNDSFKQGTLTGADGKQRRRFIKTLVLCAGQTKASFNEFRETFAPLAEAAQAEGGDCQINTKALIFARAMGWVPMPKDNSVAEITRVVMLSEVPELRTYCEHIFFYENKKAYSSLPYVNK